MSNREITIVIDEVMVITGNGYAFNVSEMFPVETIDISAFSNSPVDMF